MADSEPRPPNRSDSQATAASLRHLDPSPIDSPRSEKDRSPLPREDAEAGDELMGSRTAGTAKPGSTSAPGLSGSGRGSIYYLTRIQKYSSYAMSIFTSLHLCNVSLIPATTGSVDASEAYLLMTREIYQTSIAEPILVALPFVAHVGSGIALRLLRRAQNVKRYGQAAPDTGALGRPDESSTGPISSAASGPRSSSLSWPPLSYISLSGYVFTLLYSAHVFTNRILPLVVEGGSSDIGLAYVAHGFARHPFTSRLAYVGLIAAGAGHMVWGLAKWLGFAPSTRGWLQPRSGAEASDVVDKSTRRQRRRKWMGVHGAATAVAALWAVGGLGVVARAGESSGWVGKLYDGLFATVGM